jgi:LmbE family N-acetylglucosaminyl deacetylase
MIASLEGRVVVVSPHLDDAAFSLGASIAAAARGGNEVTVLTVFAGDPASRVPAGDWDSRTGFATAGDAARVRRAEDAAACAALGARPVWLPFFDAQYPVRVSDDEVWESVAAASRGVDLVLVPGFPLRHPDHLRLLQLASSWGLPATVALYVEQPYAWREPASPNGGPAWAPLRGAVRDRRAKRRALRAYRSQLPMFGKLPLERIALYELRRGGETVAPLA